LAAARVVLANEQDERLQDFLHRDDVDKATIKSAVLGKDADFAVSHLAVEARTRFIERQREQYDFMKVVLLCMDCDRTE
jgi:hypothetical protein